VDIEVVPPLGETEQQAVRHALVRAGIRLDALALPYLSAWRRAAALESVDNEPDASRSGRYAPSPRSTRGATRA
jgi:hypothetical protein